MSEWEADDDDIMTGKRRMRSKRRMDERRSGAWIAGTIAIVALIAAGVAAFVYFNQPSGLASIPDPAVAAGTFRTRIADDNRSMTVGVEIRNASPEELTVIGARIVPPEGLTVDGLSIVPTGDENQGFQLDDVPPAQAVTLAPEASAVLTARYTIDCAKLPKAGEIPDEQIYVTIKIEEEQRDDEVIPPAVGDLPWLTGTAQRACTDPVSTATPGPPNDPQTGN